MAALVVLAVLWVMAIVPGLARAEEGFPTELEALETEQLEVADTEGLVAAEPEDIEAPAATEPEAAEDTELETTETEDTEADAPADSVDTPDDSTFDLPDGTMDDDPWLLAQDDSSGAVTVLNLYLYDLDGTEQTLSDDYDCQKRFVIVGRPGCPNTRNVVYQALDASTEDEFADISFLVLDVDGNRDTFQEGFGSYETDRVRFFSSGNSAYSTWAFRMYSATGNEGSSVTLPFTVLVDKSNHVQAVFTGIQDVEELCRTYLSGNESNPDDVDPGDPHQFDPEVPDDPNVYDELSFSVWGDADMRSGRELLPLVNEARAAVGVAPLTWDEELAEAAYQRGAEQMVLYSHTRPNGRTCFTAWPQSQSSRAAENIAMGQTSVEQVNTDWTNSSGHYANMINDEFTTFAAAHFKAENGADFWVECFGGGSGSGMTGSPAMGETKTSIGAIKGNVWLSMCVTPGVYNSWNGGFDRSVPALKTGQSQQLVLMAGNADVDAADVIWVSSDPSVVSVSDTGRMVGVSAGSADVTGSLISYPDLSVTQTITVSGDEYANSGMWGTCPWEIDDNGTLLVYPGTGEESEAFLNSPYSYWIDSSADIKAVRFVEQDGRKVVAPEDCAYLFGNLRNLVSADLSGLDTSQTRSLHGLFAGCSKLQQANVFELDTPLVVDIARLFLDCTSLRSVDLSGLDVSRVTQMYYAFEGCTALEEANVSGWDTSNVTDMDGMFRYCESLTSLDLSSWSSASLNWDNFVYPMFDGCTSLAELRVGEGFAVSDERGFPEATASNGMWWSTAEQRWVSKSDVLAGLLGKLDIFANHEVPRDELPTSVNDAKVSVTVQSATYTGAAVTPAVVVAYDGATLTEGDDYTLTYANNVNAGQATVRVVGTGKFVGSRECSFIISKAPITSATISGLSDTTFTFTGSAVTPSITVKMGNKTLVKGTDYTASYTDNVNVGTARVLVTGKGNYAGSVSTMFDISPADLSGCVIAPIASQVYTGKALEPAVTVTFAGQTLSLGTDYEVAYSDNVEAGTATATLTGLGNYAGESFTTFVIKGKQAISASAKTVAMGKTVKLGAKLTAGDGKLTYKSSNAKVAKVSAAGVITPVGVGTCKITVTAAETDGYAKATKTVTVTVTKGTQAISASGKSVKTGKTASLGAKLTAGNGKLTYKSSDTTVATVSAKGVVTGKNVGTAKITITSAGTANWNRATRTVTVKVTAQAGTWKGSGSKWWYQWADGGYPKSQFLTISGKTYYFNSSGYCVYGWQKISGKYYYFDGSGAMARSKWVGNYWLGSDGVMATNAWVDGGRYWVGADGAWVKGKTR